MEFGLAIQGYAPGRKAHDRAAEHEVFRSEIQLAKLADRTNWKYLWLPEHHALAEYSHISDCESWAGYMAAATERIHIGSGIINLSPRVNHPVRVAERAATLDHLSNGRFEFGTGRGAGSHEVATFGVETTEETRDVLV
jgi:alkanesulfonate monooxygenase SsuD/methylene tetrahydromethanopterin reductase-like flavin-dependent oxidoreductase (luciferase family)